MMLPMLRVSAFVLVFALCSAAEGREFYAKNADWAGTLVASRAALAASGLKGEAAEEAKWRTWLAAKEDFPVEWDWTAQDGGDEFWGWLGAQDNSGSLKELVVRVTEELGAQGAALRKQSEAPEASTGPDSDREQLEIYLRGCELRRAQRLKTVLATTPRIVFTKHRTVRPSFFAYTEGQSDAQHERHFLPGSELCLLEMKGARGAVRSLVSDPNGAIRDPAVSWDGNRVVFAWKKSLDEDDYHLYELEVETGNIRQITSGLGFADYEPAFLPNGDLIFASTRCVQTVDCWWTEVSNLYTCDTDGRYLRRLGFDQVHTVFPQLMDDGRVIYTRWDYNDRGQIFPQPLFQMNPDGTGQTEFYGNNSWFPTTIAHARGIPGTEKALAILCGHHSTQAGKLAIIDPAKGRQENSGVQLVAPVRETPAERIDSYGQEGELWQYPYPLNEQEYLVTYAPLGWDQPRKRAGDADFGIYWMALNGRRELLAWDAKLPCQQPVPLAARKPPMGWPSHVDYSKTNGTYFLQDIYTGPGLEGVRRGTIKKLRVVALDFRPAGIGENSSGGPGGGALICTPVAIGNGTWDVKKVLGDAKVHEDGSALFTVPARTPVYFQALDERGRAVQTMRSWSTLQPNEFFGCVGCHEPKNTAPPGENTGFSLAMKAGAQALEPFYGPARGFSFPNEIQPILDRNCVRCHRDREPVKQQAAGGRPVLGRTPPAQASASPNGADEVAFSLLGEPIEDAQAKRTWSDAYLVLTRAVSSEGAFVGDCGGRVVNWIGSQSIPAPVPPYAAGSTKSGLMTLLDAGHKGVTLTREEMEKIACWIDLFVPYCGDYTEANTWTQAEMRKYRRYADKRRWEAEAEKENIRAMLPAELRPVEQPVFRGPGRPMR